MLWDDRQRK